MVKAVIGLGSNLGDSKRHLMNAVKELNRYDGIRVTDISSLYLTKPVGPQDQNYFINAVAVIDTGYSAHTAAESDTGVRELWIWIFFFSGMKLSIRKICRFLILRL